MKIDKRAFEAAWTAFKASVDPIVPTENAPIKRDLINAIEAYEAAKAKDTRVIADEWLGQQYAPWQCSDCGHRAEGPDSKPSCPCGSKRFVRAWID